MDYGAVRSAVCSAGSDGIFGIHVANKAVAGSGQDPGSEQDACGAVGAGEFEPGRLEGPHRSDGAESWHDPIGTGAGAEPGGVDSQGTTGFGAEVQFAADRSAKEQRRKNRRGGHGSWRSEEGSR